MNDRQRHKFEYLLHLLDDEDIREATLVLSNLRESGQFSAGVYWVNDCSDDVGTKTNRSLSPTPRLMLLITIGMAIVSTAAWIHASNNFPQALYMIPAYVAYVVLVLLIQAHQLNQANDKVVYEKNKLF